MQHGLLDNADTWITNEPDIAPGFQMARAGFDCWFGNSRGNKYSRYHVSIPRNDEVFWEFTWQHMADFDVPAMVDYVLQQTGKEKLVYIGHSQGTSTMFAHLADNPDFSEKLNLFIALAPIASVTNHNSPVFKLLGDVRLAAIMQFLGVYDFAPYFGLPWFVYEACTALNMVCADIIEAFADEDINVDNLDRFPVILAHEPGGTSTRNMQHWTQCYDSYDYEVMPKFDYGSLTNMRVYHQSTPPAYNLTRIDAKVAWFVGTKDRLADPTDVAWLEKQLAPGVLVSKTELENFGHMTALWGKNMTYFEQAVSLAKKYSSEEDF